MAAWGRPAVWIGRCGTIPFMDMVGGTFPNAHYLITGALGLQSNVHGPIKLLHLYVGKRLMVASALR
jgi:hypothetical protein